MRTTTKRLTNPWRGSEARRVDGMIHPCTCGHEKADHANVGPRGWCNGSCGHCDCRWFRRSRAKPKVPPKVKTSTTIDIEIMHRPIMTVWNAIAPDLVGDFDDDVADRAAIRGMSNAAMVECCIDANRLTMFCRGEDGKRAEAELERAIAAHGYDKVLRSLSRAIKLGL